MESFLFQATLYLLAMVVAVPIAARLGLGSVLGYLVAGIVIGPVFGLVGSETADPVLGRLSLVASPYRREDGASGWLGILGPTRMDYDRTVALVDYISRLFSSLLTRHTG